ncbi:MAG: hypothetical protein ACI9SE_002307 [Neolewinella sp.]|jgi:hypothetical protein
MITAKTADSSLVIVEFDVTNSRQNRVGARPGHCAALLTATGNRRPNTNITYLLSAISVNPA